MMSFRYRACGPSSFPLRADCPECLSPELELVGRSGKAMLYTFTIIDAAPTGFGDASPYTVGVADLEGGVRRLAWLGRDHAGRRGGHRHGAAGGPTDFRGRG